MRLAVCAASSVDPAAWICWRFFVSGLSSGLWFRYGWKAIASASTACGAAVHDGYAGSLDDTAVKHSASRTQSSWKPETSPKKIGAPVEVVARISLRALNHSER